MSDERDAIIDMIRESAGAIAPRGGSLERIRGLRYTTPGYDPAVLAEMGALGWIGLRLPEERGGVGLGMVESCALYEELGRALVPEPLIAATLSASLLAECAADDELASVLTGSGAVAVAWSGDATGLTVAARSTTERHFVTGADAAETFLVADRLDEGTILLRRLARGDVSVEAFSLQDGGRMAGLTFGADAGDVVSADAADAIAAALDEAALGTAAYLLGVAEQAFAITLDYLGQREQFGQTLGSFQALQHRCADLKIQLALTRASVESAAGELDVGVETITRARSVSRAKARAADTAMLVAREAIQLHGAIGYTDEYDVGLFCRKAMTLANAYGSASAHRRRYMALRPAFVSRPPVGSP